MKKKFFFGSASVVAIALASVFGLMLYDMSQMNIEDLISCSANEGGIRIPDNLCEYYMVNYRVTERDIKKLSEGAGLEYILNGENAEKYKIAEIFISRGLDVNGINHYNVKDVTPLHAAVLYNDAERVDFLVSHGANTNIKSRGYGVTALGLAKKLHQDNDREDRSEIIQLLSGDNGN